MIFTYLHYWNYINYSIDGSAQVNENYLNLFQCSYSSNFSERVSRTFLNNPTRTGPQERSGSPFHIPGNLIATGGLWAEALTLLHTRKGPLDLPELKVRSTAGVGGRGSQFPIGGSRACIVGTQPGVLHRFMKARIGVRPPDGISDALWRVHMANDRSNRGNEGDRSAQRVANFRA